MRRGPRACAVSGCRLPTHALSRWCRKHAHRAERHGSPTQRKITRTELRPYIATVEKFLDANAQHPALDTAFSDLQKLLADAARAPVVQRPKPREWRTRLRIDLARLNREGVTGREMFAIVAALHLFALAQTRSLEPMSRPFWFQTARLMLNIRQRDPRERLVHRGIGSRLPAAALEHLGRTVTLLLWRILRAMVAAIESEAKEPQAQQERIEAAISSHPFQYQSSSERTPSQ